MELGGFFDYCRVVLFFSFEIEELEFLLGENGKVRCILFYFYKIIYMYYN